MNVFKKYYVFLFIFLSQKKSSKIYFKQVGQKVLKVLNKQRVLPNFGNAGAVETLVESAAGKAARRSPQADGSIEIRPEDIEDGDDDEVCIRDLNWTLAKEVNIFWSTFDHF